MLTQYSLTLAVQLCLHRSETTWIEPRPNPLEAEMRKRVFWALLTIHVTLSGKLGQPMPLKWEDFDVEMPGEIDDDLLSETGLDKSRPGECRHVAGLHAFKIVPLYIELYATIYAVRRRPEAYVDTVKSLEARLRTWKNELPNGLRTAPASSNREAQLFYIYAQAWASEFQLLLRHPGVSMTNDAAFNAESLKICMESSRLLLSAARQMQGLKSLDTTWYNTAVYVGAITTTLFAHSIKRDLSYRDLVALEDDMAAWLSIMGDVGGLLGMS